MEDNRQSTIREHVRTALTIIGVLVLIVGGFIGAIAFSAVPMNSYLAVGGGVFCLAMAIIGPIVLFAFVLR